MLMRTLIVILGVALGAGAVHAEVADACCVEGTGSEWAKAAGAHQPPCLLDNRCLKHSDMSSTPPTRCASMTDGIRHGWIVYPGPDGSPWCAAGGGPHPALVTMTTVEQRRPLVEEAVLAAVRRNSADPAKLQSELAASMEALKQQCAGAAGASGDEDDAIGRQSPDCAAAIQNLDQIITPFTSGEPGAVERATKDLEARVAARNPGAGAAPGDKPAEDPAKCGVPVECQSFPDKPGQHLWHFHKDPSIQSVKGWPYHCGGRDQWDDGPCGDKPENPDADGTCGVPDGCQNSGDGNHFYHEHRGGARYVKGSFKNCGGDSPQENGPCAVVGAPRPAPPPVTTPGPNGKTPLTPRGRAPAGSGTEDAGTGSVTPPSGLNPNLTIAQPNGWTCSAASLAICLAQFGMKPANQNTIEEVRQALGGSINERDGLRGRAEALAPAAQRFGLNSAVGNGSAAAVQADLARGRVVCLNIVSSRYPEGHFVNVSAFSGGVFTVNDPGRGTTYTWTAADLNANSSGRNSHLAVWP